MLEDITKINLSSDRFNPLKNFFVEFVARRSINENNCVRCLNLKIKEKNCFRKNGPNKIPPFLYNKKRNVNERSVYKILFNHIRTEQV